MDVFEWFGRTLLFALQQVFDFHHHKFCPGGLTEREAVYAAIATWPPGIRPVVHWSESQEGRKPHAHSDFIFVSFCAPCWTCTSRLRELLYSLLDMHQSGGDKKSSLCRVHLHCMITELCGTISWSKQLP